MTTLRAVQTEALDVMLPGLETVGTVLSRRSNIYGFPRFFVACFLVLSPMIAISQDHKEHYSPQVVVYEGDAVLGQLVDGAGWKTTINLVNLDTQQASFKLYFFADRGTSLTLPIVNESGQTSSEDTIQGNIPVGGSATYATEGTALDLAQGWAAITSSQRIAGQAVFRRSMPGFPDIEAVVPFTSIFDLRQVLPFDHTSGFVMGVALTNPGTSDLTIKLSFRSSTGTQLLQDTIILAGLTHTAFLLTDKYPLTKNQRGVVEITTPGGTLDTLTGIGVCVLGLRGNPSGGLTTVFAEVSPDWVTQR
jgi:hypothetical protein